MEDEDLFDLDEVPLYDPDPDTLMVACSSCDGTGWAGLSYGLATDCERCSGTGEVEVR